ncbi:MAG: CdaR family protein [Candidatus Neomarinimicrobiota bacterium]
MLFKTLPTRQQFGFLIGAFLLASLLWLFVISQNEFMMALEIPIEVRNIQAKKTLRQEIPRVAFVRFRGRGRALFKAYLLKNVFDLKLVLDLERQQTEYDFILNDYYERYPQKVFIPGGFDIKFIEVVHPDSLHILLDDVMVKKVPVRSTILAEPAPGYLIMGKPTIRPATIELSGPDELVRDISFVRLVRDTLLNLDLPVRKTVTIEPVDRLIDVSHTEVVFSLDVQAIGERIIGEVPVEVVNMLPNLRVFVNPRTVSLTITGGVERIAAIVPEDIKVLIDFSRQWNPRTQFYEPTVTIPKDLIGWSDLSPRNLELVVTKESG